MPPFNVTGLVVTAQGTPRQAYILPVALHGPYVKEYSGFPGSGIPHYELFISESGGIHGERGWIEHLVSHNPDEVVERVRDWHRQPTRIILPPLSDAELAPLKALADVRRRLARIARSVNCAHGSNCMDALWHALGLSLGFERSNPPGELTPLAQTALEQDLANLDAESLLANFPRDEQGRLALGENVLLASYDSNQQQKRDRQMWLVANAPTRRRDPQIVTLMITSLIGENHAHRWGRARFLWDRRAATVDERQRWGVSGLKFEHLGIENRHQHLMLLRQLCADQIPYMPDCVALSILLQDEGWIEDAFTLFDVQLAPEVLKVLAGQPIEFHDRDKAEQWAWTLGRELRAAAPWLLAPTLGEVSAERFQGKPDRLQGELRLRLFALPHQIHQRRASLMLVGSTEQPPRFEIEYTGSNARLPESSWRRPLELDLRRFGWS